MQSLEELTREICPAVEPEVVLAERFGRALWREAPWRLLDFFFGGPLSGVSKGLLRRLAFGG